MDSLNFLVVGRAAAWQRAVAETLRSAGHRALVAEDGTMAVQALAQVSGEPVSFDGLVLDAGLPGLDMTRLREAIEPRAETPPESLAAVERRQIMLALAHTHGNKRQAAALLGVARSTLLNKIRRYGLT